MANCSCPMPVTVEMLKSYVYAASPEMKTVVCIFDSRHPASDGFVSEFKTKIFAHFGPYSNKVQIFSIDLATDPTGLDGFDIKKPENGHIPAIWMIDGSWNLNNERTTLENVAVYGGPLTGQCFELVYADVYGHIWKV